jgi:acetyl-CoA carboxylase biotin carboxyl carrier protein
VPLDFNEIRQLLVTIAQTDIAEVTLKNNDFQLTVRKAVSFANQLSSNTVTTPTLAPVTHITPQPVSILTSDPANTHSVETANQSSSNGPAITPKWVEVTSPMVGTFYRASAPGEAPFVEVGDRVRQGQTVCIIEAMKLMNEIEAEVSGQVMEILLDNGQPLEYGQPVMRINPD